MTRQLAALAAAMPKEFLPAIPEPDTPPAAA
jgi:hypothetical protein